MKRLQAMVLAAAFLLGGASTAAAQSRAELDGAQQLREFAGCIVRVYPTRSIRLLETEPGSRLERARLNRFFRSARGGSWCWPTHQSVALDRASLRGAIAEALYLMRYPRASARLTAPAAPAPAAAGCVVAREPLTVDGLLRQGPGTSDEQRLLDALAPALTACGIDRPADDPSLRWALAETIHARARGWPRAGWVR